MIKLSPFYSLSLSPISNSLLHRSDVTVALFASFSLQLAFLGGGEIKPKLGEPRRNSGTAPPLPLAPPKAPAGGARWGGGWGLPPRSSRAGRGRGGPGTTCPLPARHCSAHSAHPRLLVPPSTGRLHFHPWGSRGADPVPNRTRRTRRPCCGTPPWRRCCWRCW